MSLGRLVQVVPQYGVRRSLMGFRKVSGHTETRMISFCSGSQKQAGEGCLRGTGDKSVSAVHPEKCKVPLRRGCDKGVPGVVATAQT